MEEQFNFSNHKGSDRIDKKTPSVSIQIPPNSWNDPLTHWQVVCSSQYYRLLAEVLDNLDWAIRQFFKNEGLKVLDLPITTSSVSSPMGLGSDSKPVEINLFGNPIYLADSMQFLLELGCRIFDSGTGYKMLSFRGEDSDKEHLSQFHHAECEILGTLTDIMNLGCRLIDSICRYLITNCSQRGLEAIIYENSK